MGISFILKAYRGHHEREGYVLLSVKAKLEQFPIPGPFVGQFPACLQGSTNITVASFLHQRPRQRLPGIEPALAPS